MSGLTFFNLAGDILACGILNSEEYNSREGTRAMAEADGYLEELYQRLRATGLTEAQKALLDTIEEVVSQAEAAVRDYHFLLGMRAQAALQLILEDPAGVLDFSEARFPGVRELCKVKQEGV